MAGLFTWRRAQWLAVPLLVLGLAEWFVRQTADRVPTWYGAAQRLAAEGPIGVVLVGSSRVQAAVLPADFAAELGGTALAGRQVLNLARGYSTDAEHYLGLRNLLQGHPAALRGVQVLAEATGGVPFRTTWRDHGWAQEQQPWMLVDLLSPSDLPAFLRSAQLGLGTRLHVSLRVLLRPVRLFNRRERVRQQWLEQVLPTVAAGQLPDLTPNEPVGFDLQGPGAASSIRVDPQAVALARASALQVGEMLERHQAPMREWHGTVQEDLVRLVRDHGGRLVFFEPPLSEVFQRAYRTPLRREDVVLFGVQAGAWSSCVVRPDFQFVDDDLPDLWHLRPELAPEFSRALARAFLRDCPPAP